MAIFVINSINEKYELAINDWIKAEACHSKEKTGEELWVNKHNQNNEVGFGLHCPYKPSMTDHRRIAAKETVTQIKQILEYTMETFLDKEIK